jgi:uncharacterized protein YlbG (UPF0298 family)
VSELLKLREMQQFHLKIKDSEDYLKRLKSSKSVRRAKPSFKHTLKKTYDYSSESQKFSFAKLFDLSN